MGDDLIGNAAAAEHVGVTVSTWRAYVARGYAGVPQPYRRHVRGGHALPVWRRADLDAWQASRRGQGWARGVRRTPDHPTGGTR